MRLAVMIAAFGLCAVSAFAQGNPCLDKPDGTPCNDNNWCTDYDACRSGWCQGTAVENGKDCDDRNPCTKGDVCQYGWCRGSSLPDGTSCDDDDPCTAAATCASGACGGSIPFVATPGATIAATAPLGVGDFNRDGRPDIVAGSTTSSATLLIRLGDGSGGFTDAPSVQLASGTQSPRVAVADFNLDGKPDLVAVDRNASQPTIGVYLGNGVGGFVPAPTYRVPLVSYVTELLAADFDGDRKPDLAVLTQSPDVVTMLLGDGRGGFANRGAVSGGPNVRSMAAGDFNGDGHLDLAISNPVTNGGVVIAIGDGTGGFVSGSVLPAGSFPASIAVGDYDGDGDLDLAVADIEFGTRRLWILAGDGQGAFSLPFAVDVSSTPNSVVTADLDLDGTLDLVVGYDSAGQVSVLRGTRFGYFQRVSGSPVTITGTRAELALADFDGDGRQDVAIATSRDTRSLQILLNRSVGAACPAADGCSVNVCDHATGACRAVPKFAGASCDDRDACTTNDACVGGACVGGAVSCVPLDVCHVQGTCDTSIGCVDANAPEGTACTDADACTHVDGCESGACVGRDPVICTSDQPCKVGVCDKATGACGLAARPERTPCEDGAACTAGDACHLGACVSGLTFANPPGSPVPVGTRPSPLAVADLDGDLRQDLAVVNGSSDNVTLLAGDGTGGFAPFPGSPVAVPRSPSSIATADVNHDGRPDLLVTSSYSNPSGFVSVLLAVPGGWAHASGSPFTAGKAPSSIAVGDFNRDGEIDFAVSLGTSPNAQVRWFLGDGTGQFAGSDRVIFASSTSISMRLADLDMDGETDLVAGNGSYPPSATISYRFTAEWGHEEILIPGGCWGAIVGDVDGDGRPDIVCAGRQFITVLRNSAYRTFTQIAAVPWDTGAAVPSMELADFNLDGHLDLAVTKSSTADVTIFQGDGRGRFAAMACSPIGGLGSPGGVAAADFDADGQPDFALAAIERNAVAIFLGEPALSPDGTMCSDGIDCTLGDACLHGACRGGAQEILPEEVAYLAPYNKLAFSWTPAAHATRYDLVRADLSSLPPGSPSADPACIGDLTDAFGVDWIEPLSGHGFWYLARGDNACGAGPLGVRSDGSPRMTTICP